MTYRFELGKRDSILLGTGAALLGIVLFIGGFLTDRLIISRPLPSQVVRPRLSEKQSATLESGGMATTKPAAPTTDGQPPETTVAALHASLPSGSASPANSLQLAVQVGTFAEPNKAKHMVEQLQKQGFSAVISSQTGLENQQVSVVEVGPFSAWDDASKVAQLIGRSLGTHPAIRPML